MAVPTNDIAPARSGVVLAQFLGLALVWGSSFLFIAVGLTGLSPSQVVLARLCTGAITLAIVCAVRRRRLPRQVVVWLHILVGSLLLCVVPFMLFAWAQQHVSSGLASIYNATTPLMATLFTVLALRAERPTLARAAGLAIGFLGVMVVLAPWNGFGGGSAWGQLACLGATACYGAGMVYLRKFVSPYKLSSIAVATVQVGLGAIIMLILAPFVAMTPVTLSLPIVLSMIALGALGTGLAYVWNFTIISTWGATSASTVTYLTPIVGVVLGIVILSESISWNEPVGAAVVIIGIAVSQGRIRLPRRR